MQGADGQVIISTKIDTTGIKVGLNDIQNLVRNLKNTTGSIGAGTVSGIEKGVQSVKTGIQHVKDAVGGLRQSINNIDAKPMTDQIQEGTQEAGQSVVGLRESFGFLMQAVKNFPANIRTIFSSASQSVRNLGADAGSSANQTEQSIVGLRDSFGILWQSVKNFPGNLKTIFSSAAQTVKGLSPSFESLQEEIDRYTDALHYAKQAGYSLGDAPYDEAYAGLQRAKQSAESYRSTLLRVQQIIAGPGNIFSKLSLLYKEAKKQTLGLDSAQKKATKSGKKLNNTINNTHKSSKKSNKGLLDYLKTILKYTVGIRSMYILFNRIRSGLVEGMKNLAQYSDDTNTALSRLMSAMTRLKNSFAAAFAPLVQFVEPALTRFINLLSRGLTYIGKLFAALTGKEYFEQAKEVQQDFRESLDKTKDSAKKTQKQLTAFDELNVLDFSEEDAEDQSEGLKPEDMFETVKIEQNIINLAEKIKGILSGLFAPLKASWLENGPYVIDSMKYAAESLKQLASDMGASFMQVWNTEGYGKAITDDLLITLGNLFQIVGNLATQFDKAWVSGETGTNILRHLGDIILEITGFFRAASESIMNWSKTIDFSPLLKAFDGILVAVRPIVNDVGSVLLWLLNHVLLPLAKWGIEQALPAVFNVISAALKALHSVIQALKPFALWLWDSFLQPIGKWTGQVIIAALQKLVEWLTKFSDWITDHQEAVKYITVLVVSFFAAWKITEFAAKVALLITVLKKMVEMLTIVSSKLGIDLSAAILKAVQSMGLQILRFAGVTAAITGLIALIAILAMNWDKMTPGEKVVAGILAAAAAVGILAVALGAIAGGVGAAVVAASLAAGIAAATIAINAGKRQVANYQSSARSGRSAYPTSAYSAVSYRMPRLATGTVVPPRAGEFAAILGDNKREPEVVSPLSTIEQGVENALSRHNFGGGDITIKFTGSLSELVRLLKPELDKETSRRGVNLVIGGAGR